jgi:SAM-dependent methyltransferase
MSASSDYRKSHIDSDKGCSYHKTFSENPYRAMIWGFERRILDRIITEFYPAQEITHLDFACGTGRVLKYLANRCSLSVGVDLSPSMLEVARSDCLGSEVIEADLTRNDILGDREFNLVTAFRFFPNAEPELRQQAMAVLTKHLCKDGFIVFNNHKHTGSSRNRLARLFGRRGFQGMSIPDVKELVTRNNLEVERTYHLCVFPASEKHMLLPEFALRKVEGILARIPALCGFGENLVFVCKRAQVT